MKSLLTTLLLLSALPPSMVRAQQVDAFLGVGTARAASAGQPGAPAMGGVFEDFGLSLFVGKQVGLGWTASWRAAHDYGGLQYRPAFHTFDAIWVPLRLRTRRSATEIRAGLGFAGVHFDFDDPQSCDQLPGCPSSHYFLQHLGAANRFYVTGHLFLRPAVDIQHVNKFVPFGTNWVPRYSLSLGYSFGKE